MDYQGMNRDMEHLVRLPTKSKSLVGSASGVLDTVVNNPGVGTAIQILDTLADLGKALPFVAPAFVVLKVIIDLEKGAQDVDAKCNDLLERITFMLSHLPALQKIEIMAATRQVIDRMNEALKDAASLISAYRKQSRVARRLKISNRDNFKTCAESINTCCRDLVISLQIQQTVHFDILTRDVPIDDEDRAAWSFIETHGGNVNAVTHDRELVKEFCQHQHFVMDDSVMEQLNANIADSVQQSHARLESILRDNVGSAIANGLKNLAMEMNTLEAEQKFYCVQCNKEFTNQTNGPKACSFHRDDYNSSSKQFSCCSTVHPCQFGTHRVVHHCDYPYGAFFARALNVLDYPNNYRTCVTVEDADFETNDTQKAFVGELFRWKSGGENIEKNTILVVVGRVSYKYPYYFNTFTSEDLEDITNSVRLSQRTLIFRTSSGEAEFAMAEWIISDTSNISGIRLTAKSATSDIPWIRVCPIDPATCTKCGDVLTTSEGGLRSYIPATPYVVPETITIGPILKGTQSRPVRTDFKTQFSPSLRVILKVASDPSLRANSTTRSREFDFFDGKVSIFNHNQAGSLNPVTIASVSAFYRMIGDPEYAPVGSCKLLDGLDMMPVTIEPRKSWLLNFQVAVPRTQEDVKYGVLWTNKAFLARHRPIRIKLVIEDIDGEQCSLVLEYVFTPYPLSSRRETDLGFFFFDNIQTFERSEIRVTPPSTLSSHWVIEIGNNSFYVGMLEKIVYQALKSGKTEVDLKIGVDWGEWEWNAWALVDTSCQRVYAFKIIVQEGKKILVKRGGCMGYVLCPSYGRVHDQKRPIRYGTETVKLPPMDPYPSLEYPQDDDVDDLKPPIPPKPLSSVAEMPSLATPFNGGGAIPVEHVETIANRLVSIDNNLARIATSFEKLLAVMANSNGDVRDV